MNCIRIVGAAIGANVIAIIIELRITEHGSELLAGQTADNVVAEELRATAAGLLAATGLPTEGRHGIAAAYSRDVLSLKAHELAFQDGYLAVAVSALVGLVTAAMLLRRS